MERGMGRTAEEALACDLAAIEMFASEEKNHRYDLQTAAIIRRVLGPGDLAVDIGAHTGEILFWFFQAAPEVSHLAVEPIPHLAAGLRSEYPTAEVHEVALVAEPAGPITFHHVVSDPGYSGIRRRVMDRAEEEIESIEVATTTLDSLVGDRSVSLVKLDVEGAELGVFQGGERTISRDRPVIIFEHGLGAADVYGTRPGDVYDILDSFGLDLFLLATFLETGPPLSRAQFEDQFNRGRNYYFVAGPDPRSE